MNFGRLTACQERHDGHRAGDGGAGCERVDDSACRATLLPLAELAFLEAIDSGVAQTPADLASVLGIGEGEAASQLSGAENDWLVAVEKETTRHVMSGVESRSLRLTEAGRTEMNRLRDERSDR